MNESRVEALIGLVVLVVAGLFLAYMLRVGPENSGHDRYPLIAEFTSAQGVAVGTEVRMAGIVIGVVTDMVINQDTYKADVTMMIDTNIEVYEDSFAKIASESLLGGSFVELIPGVIPIALAPGDRIIDTQGPVDLIDVLSGFVE